MNHNPGRMDIQRTSARTLASVMLLAIAGGCHPAARPHVDASPTTSASTGKTAAGNASAQQPLASRQRAAAGDAAAAPRPEEVSRTAVDVFGDTATVAPAAENPTGGPTWDIDVRSYEGQERVAFYVNLFTQTSRSRFQERLHLGTRYEPMIRAKLRAGGIPEDMAYLALVESGFDPNAYSSAAAVGMWQFMSSTARDVGLRVDWWVDERRDPARSTDAAIRFIRDLQNQFGSLYLAAAAYNGGPGRVSRGLTRFAEEMVGTEGEDRFFALAEHDYLRSETKNYVPQIIAAALVGKEPVRYGFSFDTLSQYAYDSVEVAAGTPLSAVAKASGVDLGTVKELNPAVLRGIVPPNSALWVRVPVNGAVAPDQISTALANLSPDERAGFRTVKATGAETASGLASQAGVTARQFSWYNPSLKTTRKGKVLANQVVLLPTLDAVAGAANVPDPSIERYGSSTVAAARSGSVHIVKRGESLGHIAARYNMTVARLKSLNGIRGNRVVAGQALRIKSAPVQTASVKSKSSAKSGTQSSAKASKKSVARNTTTTKAAAKKSTPSKSAAKKAAVRKASAKRTATSKVASRNN